jgi:8-oxo-dGTP pyrophosphatase MutT (NUDIX family)
MDNNKDVTTYQLYQDVSAGGVPVIVEDGVPKFVAIDRVVIKDTSLPKGHQDEGESLQQTAVREVLEETGFKAEPVEYLGEFTYEVKNEVHKKITMVTVHWFLMIVKSGKPRKANGETKQVRLLPLDSDLSILTYENHRMFVEKAKKVISKHLSK